MGDVSQLTPVAFIVPLSGCHALLAPRFRHLSEALERSSKLLVFRQAEDFVEHAGS